MRWPAPIYVFMVVAVWQTCGKLRRSAIVYKIGIRVMYGPGLSFWVWPVFELGLVLCGTGTVAPPIFPTKRWN